MTTNEITPKKRRRWPFIVAGFLLSALATAGGAAYYIILGPNVCPYMTENTDLYIPTGAVYETVLDSLRQKDRLRIGQTFDWVAQKMNYPSHIYPGRYVLRPNMSNRDLVNMLRSGKQTPINFTIHNIRTQAQLTTLLGEKLEADTTQFAQILSDTLALDTLGFKPDNVISIFLSDSYQFDWNTSAEQFFRRMLAEYKRFWTPERLQKADTLGLTPHQAITLAAIVEEETAKNDEMDKIAKVYLNRLNVNMPLQADPTVKFAVGDFALRRITETHLQVNSPYNTYKNTGLPPGPIRIPAKRAVEAVLNPAQHDYLYFCAKEDFSGYHNFAATYQEHLLNAQKYHDALDRQKIK